MAQKVAAVPDATPVSSSGRANILVVDDRPESLLAMEALLAMLGQNVVTARSGAEALRHALAMDFAVILLDVSMPDMDGFETAALIRERPRCKDTPIIFMTAALKNESNVFKGYAAGAVDYLIKPVVPDILRSKVSIFVELARKREELRRLNEELQIQAAALETANKELEAFSYSVSHDLRAPLRGIDGFSQMLAKHYAGSLDERGKELLQRLQGSADRMSRLIDDLLELSRVSRKEMRSDEVDLSQISRVIFARLRREEPERRVEARAADGLKAVGDPGLLAILLDNLLSNAWKFTRKKEAAVIEFGSLRRGEETPFFVRDNGVGFDMGLSGKLFTPFTRLHKVSDFPGTGIGLATAQRIAARHGGRIWIEGAPDAGAAVYFTLGGRKP